MCTGARKRDRAGLVVIIALVNQEKVSTDMTFSSAAPIAFQWVIMPFRTQWSFIGDQQHHRFF